MTMPRIILATGPAKAERDAIVLDHCNFTIWNRGRQLFGTGSRPAKTCFRIAAALLLRMPGLVTRAELVDHLYGDCEDGGAMGAERVVSCEISILRRYGIFASLGVVCVTQSNMGYYLRAQDRVAWKAAA